MRIRRLFSALAAVALTTGMVIASTSLASAAAPVISSFSTASHAVLSLSRNTGPPASSVTVSGTGFGAFEASRFKAGGRPRREAIPGILLAWPR